MGGESPGQPGEGLGRTRGHARCRCSAVCVSVNQLLVCILALDTALQ